ncbi:uncharacterized protein IL334_005508 [Kwoniella shivajii]|uniref:CCHC-type domain-containing protein n=1 Tax=Kwoniella shivajii TaxID=564305 RepID=A0ABZ1D3C1_9TREE|nr:hypothetical protein IL334_005508 [Kwoniella shivajii]
MTEYSRNSHGQIDRGDYQPPSRIKRDDSYGRDPRSEYKAGGYPDDSSLRGEHQSRAQGEVPQHSSHTDEEHHSLDEVDPESEEELLLKIARLELAAKRAAKERSARALSVGMGRPPRASPATEIEPTNGRENDNHKFYQGQRLSSNVFSPGYGFRAPAPGSDALPPPEELVGPSGAFHRVYPAPSPICAPINADDGWVEPESPHIGLSVNRHQPHQSRPISPPPSSPDEIRDPPPHLAKRGNHDHKPSSDPYVPWQGGVEYASPPAEEEPGVSPPSAGPYVGFSGGVRYQDEALNQPNKPMPIDELLQCFDRFKGRASRDESAFSVRGNLDRPGRQQDPGWSDRSPPQGTRQGWGERSHRPADDLFAPTSADDGWGSPSDNGNRNTSSWNSAPTKCYNCGEEGHMARECTEERRSGGGGGGNCYNCDKPGHQSRDCPDPRKPGTFRGECNKCGERGHMAHECTGTSQSQGFERSKDYGNNYNSHNRNNDNWDEGKDTNKSGPQTDGWSGNTPSTRPAPAIHPSRMGLVDARSAKRQFSSEAPQGFESAPCDGRPRDNGWNGKQEIAPPPPSSARHAIPAQEISACDAGDSGGW